VLSTLEIIIAIAAAGEEVTLISGGILAALDQMQDHGGPGNPEEGKRGTLADRTGSPEFYHVEAEGGLLIA